MKHTHLDFPLHSLLELCHSGSYRVHHQHKYFSQLQFPTCSQTGAQNERASLLFKNSSICIILVSMKGAFDSKLCMIFFFHSADQEASSFTYCQRVGYGCSIQLGSAKASYILFKFTVHGNAWCTKNPKHAFLFVGSIDLIST